MAAGRLSPLDCFCFSERLGRSIAIRFTVVKAAINNDMQKAPAKFRESSGETASHGPLGLSPLSIVSPDIRSVKHVSAPLIDLDQESADANCETRKHGNIDQHFPPPRFFA